MKTIVNFLITAATLTQFISSAAGQELSPFAHITLPEEARAGTLLVPKPGEGWILSTALPENIASFSVSLYQKGDASKPFQKNARVAINDRVRGFSLSLISLNSEQTGSPFAKTETEYRTELSSGDLERTPLQVTGALSLIGAGSSTDVVAFEANQEFSFFSGAKRIPGFKTSMVFRGTEGGMEGAPVSLTQSHAPILAIVSGYYERVSEGRRYHISRGVAAPLYELLPAIEASLLDFEKNKKISKGCFFLRDVLRQPVGLPYSQEELAKISCWNDRNIEIDFTTSTIQVDSMQFRVLQKGFPELTENRRYFVPRSDSKSIQDTSKRSENECSGGPNTGGAGEEKTPANESFSPDESMKPGISLFSTGAGKEILLRNDPNFISKDLIFLSDSYNTDLHTVSMEEIDTIELQHTGVPVVFKIKSAADFIEFAQYLVANPAIRMRSEFLKTKPRLFETREIEDKHVTADRSFSNRLSQEIVQVSRTSGILIQIQEEDFQVLAQTKDESIFSALTSIKEILYSIDAQSKERLARDGWTIELARGSERAIRTLGYESNASSKRFKIFFNAPAGKRRPENLIQVLTAISQTEVKERK